MHTPAQLHRYRVPIQRDASVRYQAFALVDATTDLDHVEVTAPSAIDAMLIALREPGVWNAFTPTEVLALPLRRQQLEDAGVSAGLSHRLANAERVDAVGADLRRAA
jgi:hypothetical protein